MARRRKRATIAALFEPKHPYLPGTEILRQLDVDRLAEELDLDAQGRTDGADGVPPPDGRTLAVKERDIVGRLREVWDTTIEGAKRAYEGIRGRHSSFTADTEIDSLLAEPAAIVVQLREAAREDQARLAEDYVPVRLAQQDLEDFRRREHISHAPRPEQPTLHKLVALGAAALLEVAVNAAIFAEGDQGGILGAVLKVFVIPVANIGGCWLWTHLAARHVLSRHPVLKVVGVAGWAWTILWLIGLNLAVAHWREAAAAVVSPEAAMVAFQQAITHPLDLHSFQSWGLFAIGCAAGVIAIYEGWAWKDPHPGYARRAATAQKLSDTWWALRKEAMDRLDGIREASTQRFAGAQRQAELAMSERPNLALQAASLADDVRLFADHIRYCCEELTARYREANLRARTGEPPPQFEKPLLLNLELPALPALSDGSDQRQVAGRLAQAIQQVTTAYAESCAMIPRPEDLPKLEVGA